MEIITLQRWNRRNKVTRRFVAIVKTTRRPLIRRERVSHNNLSPGPTTVRWKIVLHPMMNLICSFDSSSILLFKSIFFSFLFVFHSGRNIWFQKLSSRFQDIFRLENFFRIFSFHPNSDHVLARNIDKFFLIWFFWNLESFFFQVLETDNKVIFDRI